MVVDVDDRAMQKPRGGAASGATSPARWLTSSSYYRAADVFVMPSIREAFGMALVEAMAIGAAGGGHAH